MSLLTQSQKRKRIRRIAVIASLSAIIVFFLLIITLPFLLKGKISELAKSEINKQLEARVEFGDVNLSLLRSFPYLNVAIKEIQVEGTGVFEGSKLLSMDKLIMELDIMSVLFGSRQIDIRNFSLIKPDINILINSDGKANYEIFREDTDEEPSKFQGVNLKKYSITDGKLSYYDQRDMAKIIAGGFNHEGKGNFSASQFVLKTKTGIEALTYESAGVPLAKDLRLAWNLDLDIDTEQMLVRIDQNELMINELLLISEGMVKTEDEDIHLDLSIRAPGSNFRELFSLVPYAYTEDFSDVEASGEFSFQGFIRGVYNQESDKIPGFDFQLRASDSYVKYPGFDLPLEKINAEIRIFNDGNSLSNTFVNIDPLGFSVGGESFLLKSLVSNLDTDPETIGEVKGTLNLGALSRAFPMPDVKRLSGKIIADVDFNVNQSMTKQVVRGNATVSQLNMMYSDLPDIKINSLNAEFRNDQIICRDIDAIAGKSDFSGTMKIIDPLNINSAKKPVTLDINSNSALFDASEWMSAEDTESSDAHIGENAELVDLINRNFIIKYNLKIGKLLFDDYDIADMKAEGILFSDMLLLNSTEFLLSGSRVSVQGQLNNIVSWSLLDKVLSGNIEFHSPHFDLDRFMGVDENNIVGSDEEAFSIPDKMNLMVNTSIGRVNYTGKELYDLKGQMGIKDQELFLDGFRARAMGGNVGLSGIFSTKNKKTPEYDMMLSLDRIRYEDMFNQVITVQALAPVFQYLNGVFNAEFSFKGLLGEDLSPKLQSISALGVFEAINGVIRSFSGTGQIADRLGIRSIENMRIDNIKGNFEIDNGELKIKPFNVDYEDMVFNIAGSNKLDKTIDYLVKASIPRRKFDKIPGGANVNKGIDFIMAEARKKGLEIEAGENILLDILMSGHFSKPEMKFVFKGSEKATVKGELEKQAESVVADTREKVETEVDKKKEEIADKAREVLDTTRRQVETKVQETIEEMKKKAQSELDSRIDSTTKSKAEDLLNKYNPLKKKK
jgi:hypothetical protein